MPEFLAAVAALAARRVVGERTLRARERLRAADDGSPNGATGSVTRRVNRRGQATREAMLDAALAYGAQLVEHYEIARYGSLRAYAELLGMDDVAQLMSEILDQEEAADELLSEIAEDRANPMAAGEDDEDADA